ncbi:bifunctional DNA primase/polymerase [Mesorhizobium sp.]|uniref:bifunctional DNA primase/polymerase n=1 Tax=Mesorhizobium sp. TaxID=1871066 RepID=UPI0025BEF8F7|nr:bifunctional DNA primase/polymerase [Mesorhizobium sp.]
MSALFAEWQPRYAEHNVATFPVTADKVPAVKGYLKVGINASRQLAMKFPANDAFGFACKRSRITVLDVDAPDERLLADALDQHGPTPLIIRSGSGNFQAWYRHNGERRKVRPDPAKPIDILGDGFVVAPPSQGSKGQYQIIAGTLDDLDRLPTMKGLNSDPNKKQNTLSLLSSPPPVGASEKSDGARNDTLWRESMKMARGSRNIEELMVRTMEHNAGFYEPLPADEVLKIVASAWSYECEGKNWFGHGARVVVGHSIVDELAASDPRAYALLSLLMRHHWGRDFYLSKAYAETLGWATNTMKAARNALVERGLIECVHPGGRGPNDPPVYRLVTGAA